MNTISNCLVKTDHFCDYVPFVSSITNLVDLFQKCVVLPFLDKATISSNHYYQHIKEKSFARCFLLLIPVFGNIIIGIYDFSKKKGDDDLVNNQISSSTVTQKIEISHIPLEDIEEIIIDGSCAESSPCQHQVNVALKDGRLVNQILWGDEIWSIVSTISEDKINQLSSWSAKEVKEHFSEYK